MPRRESPNSLNRRGSFVYKNSVYISLIFLTFKIEKAYGFVGPDWYPDELVGFSRTRNLNLVGANFAGLI